MGGALESACVENVLRGGLSEASIIAQKHAGDEMSGKLQRSPALSGSLSVYKRITQPREARRSLIPHTSYAR